MTVGGRREREAAVPEGYYQATAPAAAPSTRRAAAVAAAIGMAMARMLPLSVGLLCLQEQTERLRTAHVAALRHLRWDLGWAGGPAQLAHPPSRSHPQRARAAVVMARML
jgi:hypothetical protein